MTKPMTDEQAEEAIRDFAAGCINYTPINDVIEHIRRLRELVQERENSIMRMEESTSGLVEERDRLREELESSDLFANLLRRTAEALGKPLEGDGSTWHDIPECVAKLREENERLNEIAEKAVLAETLQKVVEAAQEAIQSQQTLLKHGRASQKMIDLEKALRELEKNDG